MHNVALKTSDLDSLESPGSVVVDLVVGPVNLNSL